MIPWCTYRKALNSAGKTTVQCWSEKDSERKDPHLILPQDRPGRSWTHCWLDPKVTKQNVAERAGSPCYLAGEAGTWKWGPVLHSLSTKSRKDKLLDFIQSPAQWGHLLTKTISKHGEWAPFVTEQLTREPAEPSGSLENRGRGFFLSSRIGTGGGCFRVCENRMGLSR